MNRLAAEGIADRLRMLGYRANVQKADAMRYRVIVTGEPVTFGRDFQNACSDSERLR